ncbi:MAG: DUF2804 domain-containing protein [Myxococcales bacterium]|nr:DUF2804 domain-containing protein [Myxococcales bacterium]
MPSGQKHSTQHEITRPGPLHRPDGTLAEAGYARAPLLDYRPEAIRVLGSRRLGRLRLKEWDYYGVLDGRRFLGTAVSHGGYAGVVFVYWIDFERGLMVEDRVLTPLGRGVDLPRTSATGDVEFRRGGISLEFRIETDGRRLRIHWPRFAGEGDLDADIRLAASNRDTGIVMATPMEGAGFYYNHKINALPASGTVSLGGSRYAFRPDEALGTLDWGRGVWPYRTFWNWATGHGRLADGRLVGLNLGKGFGDLRAATENAFFVDGRLHKLGGLEFRYDPADFMKPWSLMSPDGGAALTFTPIFERIDRVRLGIVASESHQLFGRFTGRLASEDGTEIEVPGVLGWAEEHRARW